MSWVGEYVTKCMEERRAGECKGPGHNLLSGFVGKGRRGGEGEGVREGRGGGGG